MQQIDRSHFKAFPRCKLFFSHLLDQGYRIFCDFFSSSAAGKTRYFYFECLDAKKCTVLFHGAGNDSLFGWENLIFGLLRSGRSVFTFDLPGHGVESTSILSEDSLASGLTFLSELPQLLPQVRSFDLIAYSLGALFLLQTIKLNHLEHRRSVIIGLPPSIDLNFNFLLAELVSGARQEFWHQVYRFGWRAALPAFGRFRRKEFPIRINHKVSYITFVDRLLKQWQSLLVANMQSPTLLIYGKNDYLAHDSFGAKLANTMQGSKLIVFDHANHFMLPLLAATTKTAIEWLESP